MPIAPTSPSSCARTAASSAPSGPVARSSSSRSPMAWSCSRSTRSVCSRCSDALICATPTPGHATGLRRQEDPVADLRHPRPQPQLGIPVVGRDVEVVDPAVEGLLDGAVRHVLRHLAQRRRAVDEDRTLVPQASESPLLHSQYSPPTRSSGATHRHELSITPRTAVAGNGCGERTPRERCAGGRAWALSRPHLARKILENVPNGPSSSNSVCAGQERFSSVFATHEPCPRGSASTCSGDA